MKKITIKAIFLSLLLFGVFVSINSFLSSSGENFFSLAIQEAKASSPSNSEKVFYLGAQIAIAFENALRGLKPYSTTNYSLNDTTHYLYMGDQLYSSSSTRFGTTYYSFMSDRLWSVRNFDNGDFTCSYMGDEISSCTNYFSLGGISFSLIGTKLYSSSNYTNNVSIHFSYIGNNLSSIYSYDSNLGTSNINGADYIPSSTTTPTASPAGGSYASKQIVALSTTTSGATIHYTADGSTPTAWSPTYYQRFLITRNLTLKAIAVKSGMANSNVMSEAYTINTSPQDTNTNNNTSNSQENATSQVTTDTSTLAYSISKKTKKRISYTFTNLSLTSKKYVTMRIGGRKVKVVGLRRSGSDSIATVELKYAKWGRGNYNLAMSYKNQTKVAYKDKKGKTKYKKGWERGSVSQDNILSIQ